MAAVRARQRAFEDQDGSSHGGWLTTLKASWTQLSFRVVVDVATKRWRPEKTESRHHLSQLSSRANLHVLPLAVLQNTPWRVESCEREKRKARHTSVPCWRVSHDARVEACKVRRLHWAGRMSPTRLARLRAPGWDAILWWNRPDCNPKRSTHVRLLRTAGQR